MLDKAHNMQTCMFSSMYLTAGMQVVKYKRTYGMEKLKEGSTLKLLFSFIILPPIKG